jgi:hypothetical protein
MPVGIDAEGTTLLRNGLRRKQVLAVFREDIAVMAMAFDRLSADPQAHSSRRPRYDHAGQTRH